MKYVLWISFSLCFYKGMGQSYKIVFYNQCTQKYSDFPECFYSLKDSRDCTFYVNNHNNNEEFFVKLPKIGKYRVYSNCLDDDSFSFEVNIKNDTLKIDTLNISCLELIAQVSTPPISHYYCCKSVCNGRFTDYYHNGKIRKTGVFKKGQAIDTVKEYYSNGKLKRLFIPLQRWWKKYDYVRKHPDFIWMDYHESGYLIRLWDTRKNRESVYHPNQKIKSDYQYKRKQKYIEYDTNGIKKAIILFNKKKDIGSEGIEIKKGFFVDGSLQYVLKKQNRGSWNSYFYQEYDKKGDLIRSTEFDGDEYQHYRSYYNNYPESIEHVPLQYMKEDILYISSSEKIKKIYEIDSSKKGKRTLQKIISEKWTKINGTWITKISNVDYNQKP